MIINGNGQKMQVCNLLILNTENGAWLNRHVARFLTKKIEISPQKCANVTQNNFGGLATLDKKDRPEKPCPIATNIKGKFAKSPLKQSDL